MKRIKKIVFALCLSGIGFSAFAQTSNEKELSLDEAIQLGLENHQQL
nr:hypothetical protein [uncultured Brumimicrobium sp.]